MAAAKAKSSPKKTAAKKAAPKKAAKSAAKPLAFEEVQAPAAAAPLSSAGAPYPQTPVLETPMAAVVLIVNVIIPGLGTLVGGIIAHQKLIGRAIAQFLLAIVIVGWVWGIITGIQALINASWAGKSGAKTA